MFNIIIPTLVLTSLSVLTFLLPTEFGERVTLVIEAFLAMTLIIVTVSDSIPVMSDSTPIIVKIILVSMFQIGGSLLANCMVLNMYKKHEMPEWVRTVFLHYIARCLWIETGFPREEMQANKKVDDKLEDLETRCIKLAGTKPFKTENYNLSPSKLALALDRKTPPSASVKLIEGINVVTKRSLKEEEMAYDKEFWIFVSEIADRIFLILFSTALIISSLTILSEVPSHYLH